MAKLQHFQNPENVKISILPFTQSRKKCYIFENIERILKKLFLAERWWRWLLWLKISRAQMLWFYNGNITTFPTSRKCKNFNSSLYTVPAEMLYFRKYITNSQKTFLAERWWRWLCGWKFQGLRYFGFAMPTLQLFQHPENVKISVLPFTQSQQKCYIFESI